MADMTPGNGTINVELTAIPRDTWSGQVQAGLTIAEVLQQAGPTWTEKVGTFEIRLNGALVQPDLVLHEDADIYLSQKVKGN